MSELASEATTESASAWTNGVTLKRTTSGYTWSIAVASTGPSFEEMSAAAGTAKEVDRDLTETYGEPAPKGRRTR